MIGEGIADIMRSPYPELLYFLPFLLLAFTGYVITWFRERAGAWIMIIAGVLTVGFFEIYLPDHGAALMYGGPYLCLGAIVVLFVRKYK